ncbi:STN domain-containing protein [uncultured Gimesia sp.]|jgi:hypothetical protein|uniref:STN domain-containing protein n=1 Tax=uncultured Gimesia sp. TaxID=1678688 RepID=UPI00260347B1|nr:STN domain-containing protein [uncultured Gimesia sp.]
MQISIQYKHRRNAAVMVAACLLAAGWLAIPVHADEKQTAKDADSNPAVNAKEKLAKQSFYPALTKREEKLEAALQSETEANFPEIPLSEVITYFSTLHKVTILIQEKDLQEIDVSVDQLINISLKDISLQNALIQILDPIDLTYVVDRDLILITTKDQAANMLKTRVYPVGDLCRSRPDIDYQVLADAIRNSNLGDWKSKAPRVIPGGFGGGSGPQQYVNELGGTISEVTESQSLVISQTYHAHNAIVELLTQLRQARADLQGTTAKDL